MVKVVGLANTLRILSCSNNIFPLVIEICHTSHNKGPSRKFLMNHLHDAHFFEKKISSFKGSFNQTTHVVSYHIISNEYRIPLKFLQTSWGSIDTGQKKSSPKKSSPSFFRVANPGTKEIETSFRVKKPSHGIDREVKKPHQHGWNANTNCQFIWVLGKRFSPLGAWWRKW